jgi:hypothetical protein
MAANFWTSSHKFVRVCARLDSAVRLCSCSRQWLVRDGKSVYESHPKDLTPFKSRKNIWHLRLYFVECALSLHVSFCTSSSRQRCVCADIHKFGKRMRLRQRILSTACVFFKRFYLKYALFPPAPSLSHCRLTDRTNFCEFDPRLVAPTMLFIAAKVLPACLLRRC